MEACSLLVNLRKGMQGSTEQPLVGEEHCVTTLITAAEETNPTPLIRPNFHGPCVVVLTGFHCNSIIIRLLLFLARAFVYVESYAKHFRPMSFLCFRLGMVLC